MYILGRPLRALEEPDPYRDSWCYVRKLDDGIAMTFGTVPREYKVNRVFQSPLVVHVDHKASLECWLGSVPDA